MALGQVIVVANQIEVQRLGYSSLSLTEFASNLEPEIAAGGAVEVGGALYEAAADEPITGLAAIAVDSQIYIMLTVAGASVTASGTVVAPAWDSSKCGFYSGAARAIGGLYKDAGGNYTLKWLYEHVGNSNLKLFGDGKVGIWDGRAFLAKITLEIGVWDMDADDKVAVAGIPSLAKIRTLGGWFRNDSGTASYNIPYIFSDGTAQVWLRLFSPSLVAERLNGGLFDNASFNDGIINRGYVTIEYEV